MSAIYLLAQHDLLSLFSYGTKDQQPSNVTTHHGLGYPHLITTQENTLQMDLIDDIHQLWYLPLC